MAAPATTQHQCLIYEGSPAAQLPAPAAVAKQRLEAGSRQLVLDSPAMVAGFRSRLVASGADEADAVYKGALNLSSGQGQR